MTISLAQVYDNPPDCLFGTLNGVLGCSFLVARQCVAAGVSEREWGQPWDKTLGSGGGGRRRWSPWPVP